MKDLNQMRLVGGIVAKIFNNLKIQEGMSALDIDKRCLELMEEYSVRSSCLNYHGFPAHVCVSINDQICHGIPRENKIIKTGDLVSVDICVNQNNHHGDSCVTYLIGKNTARSWLREVTYNCMWNSIRMIKPGIKTGDLGYNMQQYAMKYGFDTVREFAGHGIGNNLHEAPSVPFYGQRDSGETLQEGMCITIEPMVIKGKNKIQILSDEWTAVSRSGEDSCQFEHSVLVTKDGFEVLTYNDYDLSNNMPRIK